MFKYVLLVDMDEVLANFSLAFLYKYIKEFGTKNRVIVPMSERKSFKIRDDYPKKDWEDIDSIYDKSGFYSDLEPIENAIKTIKFLENKYNIIVVTSLRKQNETCYADKKLWLKKHLGTKFADKMIAVSDKTLICGDVLIDDNPNPKKCGANPYPFWTHVIFDQPWNRDVKGPRIQNDWSNAEEIIEKVLRSRER